MQKIVKLSPAERRDIFQEAANIKDLNPAVLEKDFWVCWVLGRIFSAAEFKQHLVFKGGTSLSKAYGLIDRFSEDIDMVLDWRLLGYSKHLATETVRPLAKTKQVQFNEAMNAKAARYVETEFVGRLRSLFDGEVEFSYRADANNPDSLQVIEAMYPAAFSEAYLRPEILLEVGPLASSVPSSTHTIRPYAADALPELFENPTAEVVAIDAERTFWEKATILHQQAHRTGAMPPRYSRHYYDLYKLARSYVKNSALADMELLENVVVFKERYYPSAWARYDLARPGTFRLQPSAAHIAELAKDYREMKAMFFGASPDFQDILEAIANLEVEINERAKG